MQEKVTKVNTPGVGMKLSEDKEVVVFEFVEAHPQLFDKGEREALWKKCVEDHGIMESDGK